MAAEPVSPDVAPRTARRPSLEPVERKYSKKFPSILRATSLKANVGPWNNSFIVVCLFMSSYHVHHRCKKIIGWMSLTIIANVSRHA